jgi:hypothetical protein
VEKCDKTVLVIGALIGAGITMMVTNIKGYRKAVKAMQSVTDDDCDIEEMMSEDSQNDGED